MNSDESRQKWLASNKVIKVSLPLNLLLDSWLIVRHALSYLYGSFESMIFLHKVISKPDRLLNNQALVTSIKREYIDSSILLIRGLFFQNALLSIYYHFYFNRSPERAIRNHSITCIAYCHIIPISYSNEICCFLSTFCLVIYFYKYTKLTWAFYYIGYSVGQKYSFSITSQLWIKIQKINK